MSSAQKPKQTSRWGLSSMISGLESTLDTILADDPQASAKSRQVEVETKQTTAIKTEQNSSRTPSRTRVNTSLQDRLAKAVAAKGAEGQKSLDIPRSENTSQSNRTSLDSRGEDNLSETVEGSVTIEGGDDSTKAGVADTAIKETEAGVNNTTEEQISTSTEVTTKPEGDPVVSISDAEAATSTPPLRPSQDSTSQRPSLDILATSLDIQAPSRPRSPSILQTELTALQQTHTETVAAHRDELNTQLERIDALQSKLTYLSNLLAEQTSRATSNPDTPALERKLAEKDATIAALTTEGTKLSKTEHDLRDAIKKLRGKASEREKENNILKQRLAKAEQSISDATERARRAEVAEKASAEKLKVIAKIERDFAAMRDERESAGLTISELRRQLADAVGRAEDAEKRAQSGALESERKAVAELKDELADAKIERKLLEDRSKVEVKELKDEATRKEELAKVTEMELRGEITSLETKLEVLRSRTEEASSGATGDSQAMLLRQIETLQTQYAFARENWQGIESSLTSRVASLEKERDEVTKREADIRRKARELNSKSRRVEDELESVNDRVQTLEQTIKEQKAFAQKLQSRATTAEKALVDARADFERDKKVWESELITKLEEEKMKWRLESSAQVSQDAVSNSHYLRPDTPPTHPSFRKTSLGFFPDALGISSRRLPRPKSGTELSLGSPGFDRPSSSRRASAQPLRTPEVGTFSPPVRQGSNTTLSQLNGITGSLPGTPSIDMGEEAFETNSSPHRTINDMISVSTAGAGPSVQLVERMSAAVRRLESEKAASKEELARLITQRDEAREEVVALMHEIEEKKALKLKVDNLEKELKGMDDRYQTTLEMLGEKSERVEELMNDVDDLKKIHRDLLESLVK